MKINMLLIVMLTSLCFAQKPDAQYILKKIDENRISDTKIIVSKMVIHGRRGERTIEAKSWQRNISDSFTEYLSPVREKGTKMLKLGDQLWTYSPSTDRTILISGHMLRQSMMGSDLSYEDMMEDPLLQNSYNAEITGEDALLNRKVLVLELIAKNEDITYAKRSLWVDAERFIVLKENLFAKSGKLLKQVIVNEVMKSGERWTAKSATFKDMLKEGDGTEFIIESVEYNAKISDIVFSKASLKK